jgi:predicted component of type VI protein secretion system
MPAQLLALTDGPSILLDKPILLLGRHPECDIQLNSRKVSRRHCCVAQVHDYLVVRDLGSTNGIRINGSRVLEGKLQTGDELTIGNFRYQVTWDSAEVARPTPQRPQAVKPTPNATVNSDDLLEQAEEPVALDDSHPGPVPKAKPAVPVARPAISALPPAGTLSDSARSLLIPENLTLMPNSGAARKPGSHPG